MKPLRHVLVAVPTQRAVAVQLVPRLIEWSRMGAEIQFITVPFIDNARNVAVRHFLSTKKKYLFFVDSDVIPDIDAPLRLLKSKKDIIGGWYNLVMGPTPEGAPVIKPGSFVSYDPSKPLYGAESIKPDTGVILVSILSGGLILIKRSVFEKIPDPWFKIQWDLNMKCFIGEDVLFSRQAEFKGMKLYCDTSVFAPHSKEILI